MRKLVSPGVILILLPVAVILHAAELKPYQQDALERILDTMDAQTRAYARPQLEEMLAGMGEPEVQMVLTAMLQQAPDNPPEDEETGAADESASPEDLEYNRAQYEPALRDAWEASREFDTFVDAQLAKLCPAGNEFAVYGAGWRYEVAPMQPNWVRASDNADLDVEVLGSSYAPQDGRYRFDFSGVRNDFDKGAVVRAIQASCDEYRGIGAEFMAKAGAGMSGDMLPDGDELENAANARAFPLMSALGDTLQRLGPTGNAPILNALINGERLE